MTALSSLSPPQSGAIPPQRQTKIIRAPSFAPGRIVSDLALLYRYRDLLYTLSVHRIKVRYKQSVLGAAWAIIQPFSLMLIYTVIFTVVTKMPSTSETPYPVLIFSALLLWTFFASSLTTATNGLVSHSHLVTKVYFPREILPLTYVIAGLFDLLIASPVLLALMIYYKVTLTPTALYALPIILLMTIFIVAAVLFLSAVQVRFRDIGMALPLTLQIWMFASPVVYQLDAVPERFKDFYMLNPMAGIVENFRRVVVQGLAPDLSELGISALVAIIMLPVAFIYFKHVEATIADII